MRFFISGRRSLIIAASLAGCLICAPSGPSHADEVDDVVRAEMTRRKIPGLQLAVVRNNEIVKVASYGLADIEDDVAVKDDTLFAINSVTKAFTGVAVMQLVEQGNLRLVSITKCSLKLDPEHTVSLSLVEREHRAAPHTV